MTPRPYLSEPVRIGNINVKNRIAMPPMNTNYSNENGALTSQMEQYYIRRAKGGAGLITLEAMSVSPDSRNHGVQPMLYDERFIPALSNLVEQIQSYGTKVSVEIAHFGSEAVLPPRASASPISRFKDARVRELDKEEIKDTQYKFAAAVSNAKAAGFDAVTLHGAHGYLIAEFLSSLYNKREDEYGGSLENCMRFLLETIEISREKAGKAFPIIVRLSVDEFVRGGRKADETVEIAEALEKAGIDAIDLTAGVPDSYIFTNPPHGLGLKDISCMLLPMAKKVKESVRIPVICANTIRTPEEAEQALASGQADIIALGRPLLADPDYPAKALEGRDDEILQCLSCQHCFRTLDSGRTLRCAVNAETGREYVFAPVKPSGHEKKIAVVGSGPAGMEFARVAAMKGYDVTIFEKRGKAGGSLRAASIPPNKDKIKLLISWYERQLSRLGVRILLDTEADETSLKGFDETAWAAGANFARRIPGSEGKNVLTAVEALEEPGKIGRRVVIIGGGATGCETADYFAGGHVKLTFLCMSGVGGSLEYEKQVSGKPQRHVTLIEMLHETASDMDEFNKAAIRIILREKGVSIMTGTCVRQITESGVYVESAGDEDFIPADTVILAGGLAPSAFFGEDSKVIEVGDCLSPGRIADAVYSAYAAARRI